MAAVTGGAMAAVTGGAMAAVTGGALAAVTGGAMAAVTGGAMAAVTGGAMAAVTGGALADGVVGVAHSYTLLIPLTSGRAFETSARAGIIRMPANGPLDTVIGFPSHDKIVHGV